MPVFDGHANFAYSTVAVAPSPATSGLTLTVATADGAKFPTSPFNAVIWPTGTQPISTNSEIVRVTGVAGDVFTFTRQTESSSNRSVIVGDQIAQAVTKKMFTDLETGYSGVVTFAADESVKRITITDANVATTSKITFGVRRADITDVSDPGWAYIVNIVTIGTGSFDVLLVALDLDGPAISAPNEVVSLFYHLWT